MFTHLNGKSVSPQFVSCNSCNEVQLDISSNIFGATSLSDNMKTSKCFRLKILEHKNTSFLHFRMYIKYEKDE